MGQQARLWLWWAGPGRAAWRDVECRTATSGRRLSAAGRGVAAVGAGSRTRPGQAAEVVEAAGLLSDLALLDELSEDEEPESLLLSLLPFELELDEAGVEDELVERLSVR
jgi:hypothetical protein